MTTKLMNKLWIKENIIFNYNYKDLKYNAMIGKIKIKKNF